MKYILSAILALTYSMFAYSAKLVHLKKHAEKNPISIKEKEIHFIELNAKKELKDKKLSALRKYTLAILTAREFKAMGKMNRAQEFYKIAEHYKIEIDKKEIKNNLKKKFSSDALYFNVDLKELIKSQKYEIAILAINPDVLNQKENESLRIVYDLLNVKIKRTSVKKLFCTELMHKDLEDSNYGSVLCDFLNDYLKEGKKDLVHVSYLDDYFLKNDINERYLLNLIHDI